MAYFFRSRLVQTIDLCDPLAALASGLRWQELTANIAHLFVQAVRACKRPEVRSAGKSKARTTFEFGTKVGIPVLDLGCANFP